jgi:histidine triad (HIT) family protein
MSDCLFCKIVEGKIPAKIVHQDKDLLAFEDIEPQAPFHVLVIPKVHLATLHDLGREQDAIMGRLFRVAATLAGERGYGEKGFRTVVNTNREGGQVVFHVHMHVLAGRQMGWPPG